jgi:hypothetical protein
MCDFIPRAHNILGIWVNNMSPKVKTLLGLFFFIEDFVPRSKLRSKKKKVSLKVKI